MPSPRHRPRATAAARRRAFARLLQADRRRGGTTPTVLTPAIDAFDRQVPMTRDDVRHFGAALREVMGIARDTGYAVAREHVRDQALVIMRYFAGCGLSLCLDPLWTLLVFLRVPLDHTAIAADLERTISPEAAASYLAAATDHFSRHSPDDTVSRQ
jgi:hypothetical protein